MKKSLLLTFLLINAAFRICYSQTNEWTWISGDSILNVNGIYGTKGAAAPGNKPGAKDYAATWLDKSGNLWLFGGEGLAATGGSGNLLNDLWKYNITTNQWTWVGGDNVVNVNGVYGTRGMAAPANKPGARFQCGSVTDQAGNFWLFGGNGFAAHGNNADLNDLWKYNSSTGLWTWVSGDSIINASGLYGTKGTPTANTKPVNRNALAMWADNSGNIWIFGGNHASNNGYLSDLWKYDVSADRWTWMGGDSLPNITNSVYGKQGQPAPTNHPGSRYPGPGWSDNLGNLWLFAGQGFDGHGNVGDLNDLWEYNVANNEWTWVSGDTSINNSGNYASRRVASLAARPSSRQAPIGWNGNDGNFWIFGGIGDDATGSFGGLDDLWKYNVSTREWTWMNGDSLANHDGVYGKLGVTAPTNNPGGRWNLTGWTDKPGNLWLFGGFGRPASGTSSSNLNDLWEYNSADSIVAPVADFTASDTAICQGSSVNFTDQSTGVPGSWLWTFTGGTPDTYSAQNPSITYNKPGTYDVKLWVSNSSGADSLTKSGYIVVRPLPVPGTITGPVAVCSGNAAQLSDTGSAGALQWQSSSDGISFTNLPGDTFSSINPDSLTQTIYYRVTASGTCGVDSSSPYKLKVNPLPVPVLNASDTIFCSGDSAHVCTKSTYLAYLWNTFDTLQCTTVSSAGGYWVTVTDTNHCSAISGHQQINVYPVPSVSIIHQGDTLSSFGATDYQWLKDNSPIPNATSTYYVANTAGSYSVLVTDSNGCTSTSQPVLISGLENLAEESILIYPNPSVDNWQLKVDNGLIGSALEIFDEQGRIVFESKISFLKSKIELTVPGGVYWLRVSNDKVSILKKLVKL